MILHRIFEPLISVVMPVYNEEQNIESAINSILDQQNFKLFEFIIVNDGSDDNTDNIIRKYIKNKHIVYIKLQHVGIANALNIGFNAAIGKYIMRMDADDESFRNRMEHQFKYMESHGAVDILCSSIFDGQLNHIINDIYINLDHLKLFNVIYHPATMMRRSSIAKLPFLYEPYYDMAEDYKFWVTCLTHGLIIKGDKTVVLKHNYKINNNDIDLKLLNIKITNLVKRLITNDWRNEGELSVILTFKNEGVEVEKTVANIRATTNKNVPIILVNDGSDDNYDYEFVAKKYNCKYLLNYKSHGVAGARNDAVELVKTKYFMLLDAHMRFTTIGWDDKVEKIISEHPDDLFCSQTATITKFPNGVIENERSIPKSHPRGAVIQNGVFPLECMWTHKEMPNKDRSNIVTVPCIFGACYIMSVKLWNNIGGLKGLIMWGQDEPLLSLKMWLSGYKVYLIKDLIVGHIYRNGGPYVNIPEERISNYFFTNYMFCDNEQQLNKYNEHIKRFIGDDIYKKAHEIFLNRKDELILIKNYFDTKLKKKSLQWFYDEINDKAKNI